VNRIALFVGIVGGVAWQTLPLYPPECVPVTGASEVFCNRLWTPALAAMLVGAIGLWSLHRPFVSRAAKGRLLVITIGFALMTAGNLLEYWFAFELDHRTGIGGPIRGALWMTVLAGWLTVLVGAFVTGVILFRSRMPNRWLGLAFVLPLPLTFAFASLGPNAMGIPVGLLAILIGVHGLASRRSTAAAAARP